MFELSDLENERFTTKTIAINLIPTKQIRKKSQQIATPRADYDYILHHCITLKIKSFICVIFLYFFISCTNNLQIVRNSTRSRERTDFFENIVEYIKIFNNNHENSYLNVISNLKRQCFRLVQDLPPLHSLYFDQGGSFQYYIHRETY